MAAKKRKSPVANETTLRHVWLAGLGAVIVTRREAIAAGVRAIEGAKALQRRVLNLADDARANVRGGIDNVRGQVEPGVVKFSSEVEARLAPVLDKLGLKPRARTAGTKAARRKLAAKKAVRRTAARKPAKHAARRA